MTGRILRIELRRSTAPWLGIAFLVLTLGFTYGLSGPWHKGSGAWDQQWNGLAVWQRTLLEYTWPFVLGLAAWQGTRQRRSTMDELLTATPRLVWQRVVVLAGAVSLTLTAAAVVLFAVGAVQVAGSAEYFTLAWLPTVGVGILAVLAGALLAMGLGHLLPYVATPPVVTVAGFAVVIVLQNVPSAADARRGSLPMQVELLSPALNGPATAFTTVANTVHIGQMVVFLGIAITGFLLLTVRGLRARLTSALPAGLGVVVALTVLPSTAAAAYPVDAGASALVCDDNGPRVCVTKAHEFLLAEFSDPARKALTLLAVLPNAPTSATEVPDLPLREKQPAPRPAETLQADLNNRETTFWRGPRVDAGSLLLSMLVGAGAQPCTEMTSSPSYPRNSPLVGRLVTVSWLLGDPAQPVLAALGPSARYYSAIEPEADAARTVLFSLPREEQVRRVAAVREAGLTCQGDPLAILTTGHA